MNSLRKWARASQQVLASQQALFLSVVCLGFVRAVGSLPCIHGLPWAHGMLIKCVLCSACRWWAAMCCSGACGCAGASLSGLNID
jgi:hypothetical protein